MNYNSLDSWICGDNDPNNPANQPEEQNEFECITDLLGACYYDEAFEKICELRKDLQSIRNLVQMINSNIDKTDNVYLLKRLNTAIQSI